MNCLISLIITTYNRPGALALVLEGCAAQSDRNFEIIVADDGSTEDTRSLVESFNKPSKQSKPSEIAIQHVWQPDQGFRAAAIRNKGISLARGEYLIFLDGDCIPQRDFIARHRALAVPGRMVIGSRILLRAKLTDQLITRRLPLLTLTRGHRWFFWLRQRLTAQINKILPLFIKLPDMPQRNIRGFKWRSIKSCNLGAWRIDVDKINGFDERFIGWGHEDADFVIRLGTTGVQGKRGWYATEVFHLWHPPADRSAEAENRRRVENRLKKH